MTFNIVNDLLQGPVEHIKSPHKSAGRNVCDFVIIHYTGSHGDAASSNKWSQDPASKVSWHITIDRSGKVTQINDFRTVAWHAGQSSWKAKQTGKSYTNMNTWSIGIELANAGVLTQKDGKWLSPYKVVIPNDRVYVDRMGRGWEMFAPEQIRMAYEIALLCAQRYNCVDILGHNEISPDRKVDPGAAFPLADLKNKLYAQSWYKYK